jgi:hypothetical protein
VYVQFWVEEPSMEAFLNAVLAPLFDGRGEFEIFNFGDKRTLLSEAPGRLKSQARWMPEDWRIVVLVDEDRQDLLSPQDSVGNGRRNSRVEYAKHESA